MKVTRYPEPYSVDPTAPVIRQLFGDIPLEFLWILQKIPRYDRYDKQDIDDWSAVYQALKDLHRAGVTIDAMKRLSAKQLVSLQQWKLTVDGHEQFSISTVPKSIKAMIRRYRSVLGDGA